MPEPENPYPEDIFPDMDLSEASTRLRLAGIVPDRVFGVWGRKVWDRSLEAHREAIIRAIKGIENPYQYMTWRWEAFDAAIQAVLELLEEEK